MGKSTNREFENETDSFTTNISAYHFTDLALQYRFNEEFAVSAGINNIFNSVYNYEETKSTAVPAPRRNYYAGFALTL